MHICISYDLLSQIVPFYILVPIILHYVFCFTYFTTSPRLVHIGVCRFLVVLIVFQPMCGPSIPLILSMVNNLSRVNKVTQLLAGLHLGP